MNFDLDTHNGRINARRMILVASITFYVAVGIGIKLIFF